MATSKSIESLNVDELLALRELIDARLTKMVSVEMEALEKRMAKLAAYSKTPPPTAKAKKSKSTTAKAKRAPSKRKGKKAPAKFRDPKTGNSWSGRGLTPVWLRDYEANGGKRADLAV